MYVQNQHALLVVPRLDSVPGHDDFLEEVPCQQQRTLPLRQLLLVRYSECRLDIVPLAASVADKVHLIPIEHPLAVFLLRMLHDADVHFEAENQEFVIDACRGRRSGD